VFLSSYSRRRFPVAKIFLIFNLTIIIVIFLRGFYPNAYRPEITDKNLAYYNDRLITIVGRICEEADLDYKSRRLTICVAGKVSGQVLVTAKLYPTYDYGDFLKISGQLQAPPVIDGFDYESYLARYDIYSVMYYPKIELVKGQLAWSQIVYRRLLNVKQGIAGLINQGLPEPAAGLAKALLLGYRRTVDREDLNIFARVGLSHMIAISGSHITILSALLLNFLLIIGFNRRQSLKLIFSFLILYPLMTGLAASALRASIMGFLALLALYYERLSSLTRALVLTAAVMLIFNPRLLRDDIGFQLSFLALLGIIYIYPLAESLVNHFLKKIKGASKIKRLVKNILDTVSLTIISQLVILPIALINFQQFSLIAPLANILVLWTFPLLLSVLIMAALLSACLPLTPVLFFAPAYFLLKYIFIISNILAAPSWAAVSVTWFNWYWGTGYYVVLFIAVYILKNRVHLKNAVL